MLGDRDLLARFDLLEQRGEVRLGLVGPDAVRSIAIDMVRWAPI